MYQSLLKTKKVSIHYVQKYLGQDIIWCPGGDQTGEEWEEQLNVFKKLLRISLLLSTLLFNINTRIKLKRIMAMLGVAANSH